jgi:hypothetical protein
MYQSRRKDNLKVLLEPDIGTERDDQQMTVMYPTCKVVAARDFSVPKLIDKRFEAPKSGVMLLVEQVQIMNLNAKNDHSA